MIKETSKEINWYNVSEYHYRNDYAHYKSTIHKSSKPFIKGLRDIHTSIFTVETALDTRSRSFPHCQLCLLAFCNVEFVKPEDYVSLVLVEGFSNTVCCKYCAKTILKNTNIVAVNYKNVHDSYVEFINIIRKKKNEKTNF